MAKKSEEAYQKWLEEEFLPSVPEDKRDTFKETLLANDIAKNSFLRQSDYSRKTEEAAKLREEAEAKAREAAEKISAYDDWYNRQAIPWAQSKEAENARLKAALLGSSPPEEPEKPAPDSMKELEELKRRLDLVDQGSVNLAAQMSNLAFKAFKENMDFDSDKILTHANKNRLTPLQAYEDLTRPEREVRAAKLLEEKLSAAREEGKREALSKVAPPGQVTYSEPTNIDLMLDKKILTSERDRVRAAVELAQQEQLKGVA